MTLILWLTLGCGAALAATQAGPIDAPYAEKIAQYVFPKLADGTSFLHADRVAREMLGDQFQLKSPDGRSVKNNPQIASIIVALAERVPENGAIYLAGSLPDMRLDFRRIAKGVAIYSGARANVILGGGTPDHFVYGANVSIEPAVEGNDPLREVDMLFGHCGRVNGNVADANFIAAVNAWGAHGFEVNARMDNTLFLWFSTNWTFANYNAHLKDGDPTWWQRNCQVHMDLKGGGEKSRLYLMIETNYGNPGTGVFLENANGMALYHGATERGSSQGPGMYYLKNCTNVQLGLRRIFPGTRGFGSSAMPSHGLTVEGGKGNVLHLLSDFSNAYEESLVNSDPALQIWGASFDYDTKGTDLPGLLKFAFTPYNNVPEGTSVAEAVKLGDQYAEKWINDRNKKSGQPVTPEAIEAEKARLKTGRNWWWPLNARHEETFVYGGKDLTRQATPVPAPPSMPATNAPTRFRPLYFTWDPEFGKALLEAGADPTGKRPSDDAFAKVVFGLSADEVATLIKQVRENKDKEAYDKLFPMDPNNKSRRLRRPRLDIPAGTFLLTKTLLLTPETGGLLGAGPEKTILKFQGDIPCVKLQGHIGFSNLTIDGGRTGLEITGVDHDAPEPPLAKSYVAGQNFYNITFRNQRFAGIHIGYDQIDQMGGAEFDQDKFVNLKFLNTGDYGIFMNHGMLDKWLCLNGEFTGQKKAGIAIKYNNLIHGGVYNCTFTDIDGPGIDFMGGNPVLAYRPYITMVEQCTFTECGNAAQPAVDYGNGDLFSFTRCRIVTKKKAIACGYIGGAQQMEDVTVDVNLVPGGKAVLLRAVRQGQTARANGHILRNVTANGPVGWINDANAQNAMYRNTLQRLKPELIKADGTLALNWDTNASAHELAPPNGWVHPFILYRCTFGEKTYAYNLLNVDVDTNVVLKDVALTEKK
jgi:hypothetical protein